MAESRQRLLGDSCSPSGSSKAGHKLEPHLVESTYKDPFSGVRLQLQDNYRRTTRSIQTKTIKDKPPIMATVTVVYPQDAEFNLDYYKSTHMPLVEKHWKSFGLKSWQVSQLAPDGPYKIQATMQWDSLASFQKAASDASAKTVLGDVPNFSNKDPIILPGEVVFSG